MKNTIIYDALIFTLVLLILFFVNIPYTNIILSCLIIIIYTYNRETLKLSLGFSIQKNVSKLFVKSIVLAIILQFLSYFLLLDLIKELTGSTISIGGFSSVKGNFNIYLTSVFIGWIIGGFCEEIIFRGFMISVLMKHLGDKTGAIIGIIFTSIIFGSLHSYQGITGQILTGLTGLLFGIIYIIGKRNLWLCILTHGFVNTIGMTLLYFGYLE